MSLGISTNLEAVTARYVDVRLERKKSVLDTYHQSLHPSGKEASKSEEKAAKKKSHDREI